MADFPDSMDPGIRLVAGLGNPGREYDGTRHNIGFSVLDRLATSLGCSFSKEPKWHAHIARAATASKGADVVLIKPTTFMNLSGDSVGEYARFHRIPAASTLVVSDDVALPLGAIRIRREGGSGGQKGLESILVHFGTEQVPRLRVGIGGTASSGGDLSAHVLSRFSADEVSAADEAVSRAVEAIACVFSKGIAEAMNLYNGTPSPVKP